LNFPLSRFTSHTPGLDGHRGVMCCCTVWWINELTSKPDEVTILTGSMKSSQTRLITVPAQGQTSKFSPSLQLCPRDQFKPNVLLLPHTNFMIFSNYTISLSWQENSKDILGSITDQEKTTSTFPIGNDDKK